MFTSMCLGRILVKELTGRKLWKEEGKLIVLLRGRHGAVIHFLENGNGDKDNTEMDAFLLTVPHLVFNVDQAGVVDDCLKIASLLSGQTDFVQCQARVLKYVLNNKKFEQTDITVLNDAVKEVTEKVFDKLEYEHVSTVDNFGNNCHLPGSYQGALHAFIRNSGTNSFVPTIRDVITAGGCNCSRANYAGALLGAKEGIEGIPEHWLGKVNGIEKIMSIL